MNAVNALIHEGRDQHRYAKQRIPGEMKAGQRIAANMGQFVNEATCPVQGENSNQA